MSVGFDFVERRSEGAAAAPVRARLAQPQRLCDIAFASLFLFLLAPVLGLIALLIRLESSGPAFFRQTRGGFRGQPFEIYKFRTMTAQENGAVVLQASADDARVTRLGRFLRRTSLDELPQLVNILKGDMSLVGPRPHALAHDDYYARQIPAYGRRYEVRPGLTGWAQVNGSRGATPTVSCMERRVSYDLWYVRNASFALYLRVIAMTVLLLIKERAY